MLLAKADNTYQTLTITDIIKTDMLYIVLKKMRTKTASHEIQFDIALEIMHCAHNLQISQ